MKTAHISAGYTFFDESNGRLITISGRHFSDYIVKITEYTGDDTNPDDFTTHAAIFTSAEIRSLLNAQLLIWDEE